MSKCDNYFDPSAFGVDLSVTLFIDAIDPSSTHLLNDDEMYYIPTNQLLT